MQKSAPRPKNRIPKATEIMLNAPTISSPAAAVTTKPTHKLTNTARLMWAERSASQRIKSSARTVPAKLGNIPFAERHELLVVDRNLPGSAAALRQNLGRASARPPPA